MNKQRNDGYVVCANLYGENAACSGLAVARQPVDRRLQRMERVVSAYSGTLIRRTDAGLLIAFATADAAVLGAYEMQRRCAGLAQLPGNRLALRIGIHRAATGSAEALAGIRPPLPEYAERKPERRDRQRRLGFDAASRLAAVAAAEGIVVSGPVLESLAPQIRQIGQPLSDPSVGIAAHAFDWRCELPRHAPAPIPDFFTRRAARKLVLLHGDKRLQLDRLNSVTTFGRDPECDVVISDRLVSRMHAHIEIRNDGCYLTDQSVHGTSVVLDGGSEVLVRNDRVLLGDKGRLSFGQSASAAGSDVFAFEIINT
jgi:hypothetical protein